MHQGVEVPGRPEGGETAAAVGGHTTDEPRMADRHQQRHRTARALAEEVGPLDVQVLQKRGDVVGLLLERQGPIDVG